MLARNSVSTHTALITGADRSMTKAQAAAKTIGHHVCPVQLDLTDPDEINIAANRIEIEYGLVDILTNNAGILISGDGFSATAEDVMQSIRVNTIAPFVLIQRFGGATKRHGWGRIVNISSGWGAFDEGLSRPIAYSVFKTALNALAVSFAQMLRRDVIINTACPGWVRTETGGRIAPKLPAKGAETPVWLATLADDGPTGGFFRNRQLIEW